MKKTALMVAATVAALLLTGCLKPSCCPSQPVVEPTPVPPPAVIQTDDYKGPHESKMYNRSKAVKKQHKKAKKMKVVQQEEHFSSDDDNA